MAINKVSAGRGAAWINESIGSLRTGGKAIWMPALLVGLLGSMPYVSFLQGVFILFFYGGLVLCVSKPDGQYNVLSGFQNGNFGRILPIMILYILFLVLVAIAFWPLISATYDMMQQGLTTMDPKQAEILVGEAFIHFVWIVPAGVYLSWMSQFAIPLASIKGLPGKEAILLGSKAVFTNLGAVFVNALCMSLLFFVIMLVCMIPMVIIAMAFATEPGILEFAMIPLFALMLTMYLALMSANMFHAYRDVFGAAEPATKDTEVLI